MKMNHTVICSFAVLALSLQGCRHTTPDLSGKWVTPTACAGTTIFLDVDGENVEGLGYYWDDVDSNRYFRLSGQKTGSEIVLTKTWIRSLYSETQTYVIREEGGMGLCLVNLHSALPLYELFPELEDLEGCVIYTDMFLRPQVFRSYTDVPHE